MDWTRGRKKKITDNETSKSETKVTQPNSNYRQVIRPTTEPAEQKDGDSETTWEVGSAGLCCRRNTTTPRG